MSIASRITECELAIILVPANIVSANSTDVLGAAASMLKSGAEIPMQSYGAWCVRKAAEALEKVLNEKLWDGERFRVRGAVT